MNLDSISKLLASLEGSRVMEFELEDDANDTFVRLRRTQGPPARTASAPVEPIEPPLIRIEAGLVGRFHMPRRELAPGDRVEIDEIVGAIESMGLINAVSVPADGRIAAIHVEDGEPVEYGQLLFELDPAQEP